MTTEPKHTPQEWLKGQCNRYVNGQCTTRGCLVRGGYVPGDKVDYSVATCEPHETLILLADNERLREALREIEHRLNGTGLCLNDWDGCREIARAALSATERSAN